MTSTPTRSTPSTWPKKAVLSALLATIAQLALPQSLLIKILSVPREPTDCTLVARISEIAPSAQKALQLVLKHPPHAWFVVLVPLTAKPEILASVLDSSAHGRKPQTPVFVNPAIESPCQLSAALPTLTHLTVSLGRTLNARCKSTLLTSLMSVFLKALAVNTTSAQVQVNTTQI